MWKWMLRFSAEPNHARRHSKRASFPGGKTARFPLPALDEGDRTRAGRLLRQAGLPDQVTIAAGAGSGQPHAVPGFRIGARPDPRPMAAGPGVVPAGAVQSPTADGAVLA